MDELFPVLNIVELRVEYLDEVPYTSAEKVAKRKADQEKTLVEELQLKLQPKHLLWRHWSLSHLLHSVVL